MSEQTNARVRRIIVEQLGVDEAKVTPTIRLIPEDYARHFWGSSGGGPGDLGADSLDVVELVMAFEEEFGISIPDDVAMTLNRGTVQDCCNLIDRKLLDRAA